VLSERLGFKPSKPLRLSPYDVMTRILKVAPGAVTPFAVVNCDSSVRLLLDVRYRNCTRLMFHPLTNEATTLISPDDLVTFLSSLGRQPEWIDFACTDSIVAPSAAP
jgi:Ala-tRNA(Pro) deacylase